MIDRSLQRSKADSLISEEARWFCAVHDLLRTTFVGSRRVHNIQLVDSVERDMSLENDEGGSALITEMQRYLGQEVILRKSFFKRLVLLCAQGLKWPMRRISTEIFSIGFKPHPGMLQCSDGMTKRTLSGLPIPLEIVELHIYPFLGDSWWGVQSASVNQLWYERVYIMKLLPRPLKLFRKLFPFPHTRVMLATKDQTFIRWESNEKNELVIQTDNIWSFVTLIRYMRMKKGYRSEIVHMDGLGYVVL